MKFLKIQLSLTTLLLAFSINAQVGIGTTNPQAELDVDGGNVRFSDYGTNTHTGTPVCVLGVEADGDIIEVPLAHVTDMAGLQYYIWTGFDTIAGANPPGIDAVDTNEITLHIPPSGTTSVGPPVTSGTYTGSMQLANNGAFNAAGLRPVNDRYLIVFTGTLVVENTGYFTITTASDDGARVFIDEALILDDWVSHAAITTFRGEVKLAKGRHDIEFWYFENTGGQSMRFRWGANTDGSPNPNGYGVNTNIQASQFIIE